jgi:hypothetical protein
LDNIFVTSIAVEFKDSVKRTMRRAKLSSWTDSKLLIMPAPMGARRKMPCRISAIAQLIHRLYG